MVTTSKYKTIILIAGAAVIALALALFMSAMSAGEFAQPGQGFLSGQSNARLALAFALLTGLALVLLFLMFRGAAPAGEAAGSKETQAPQKAETPEGAAPPAAAGAEASGGIITDTAEELRTSVETIQEELEEILEAEAPADKEHMQSLYEETGRLKKIIDGMEQLSRAQELARVPRKGPLQVEPLLRDVIEKTRPAASDRDVTFNLECEEGLSMKGDAECLGRIIGNIADNAARFIKGAGSVTLTAARKGGLVVFSVTDTGTGIRRAHLAHIYERFFRGAGSGIGMGLSIAKELVDACGGTIEVRTELGKGTTFVVRVPGE